MANVGELTVGSIVIALRSGESYQTLKSSEYYNALVREGLISSKTDSYLKDNLGVAPAEGQWFVICAYSSAKQPIIEDNASAFLMDLPGDRRGIIRITVRGEYVSDQRDRQETIEEIRKLPDLKKFSSLDIEYYGHGTKGSNRFNEYMIKAEF